ncbi:MAG: hypothetical protein R2839_02905 [Thermomicrobiales bacterium]
MVRQGAIQARYIPTLLLAVANASAFLRDSFWWTEARFRSGRW